MMRVCLASVLLFSVVAEISHLKITMGDRQVVDMGAFGFVGKPLSNATLVLTNFRYYVPRSSLPSNATIIEELGDWVAPQDQTAPDYIGFSLEPVDTVQMARLEEKFHFDAGKCLLDYGDAGARQLITLPPPPEGGTERRWAGTIDTLRADISPEAPQVIDFSGHLPEYGGFMALFFFHCIKDVRYSFEVTVTEFNIERSGFKNYLSIGKVRLPPALYLLSAAFGIALFVWLYHSWRNRRYLNKLHHLMTLLTLLKSLSLLFRAVHLHVISVHGHGELYSDIPYYSLLTAKGMLLFLVILLAGTGWSIIKPFLSDKEKRMLVIILPMVLLDSIAVIVIETINEGNAVWDTWRDVRRILDIVVCCSVLLPVVWSIKTLREGKETDGKAARTLARLRQFRSFYILLVAYIYFTRIVCLLIRSSLHYRETWIGPVVEEVGTLLFYVLVGWRFRPMPDNPYIMLEQEDFDDISLRKEIEMEQQDLQDGGIGGVAGDIEGGAQRK
eukprot:TRINITY_DN94966_c0_g1_i1.p1 TRINITY_DN94966_c0_g1~~TRINITY_DN94966_c0_g1_i1.p1  ORF type:complete len:507 (-),score=96.65 TRINITY_DN94966_c0_g1_i1:53-1552(-)